MTCRAKQEGKRLVLEVISGDPAVDAADLAPPAELGTDCDAHAVWQQEVVISDLHDGISGSRACPDSEC